MKNLTIIATVLLLSVAPAFAGGGHSCGHGHGNGGGQSGGHGHDNKPSHTQGGSSDHEQIAIGMPGTADAVSKTIAITMLEKDDGSMAFEPASISASKGQTIRLVFTNAGNTDHEFVMDTSESILEHKVVMEKWPEMEHAEPNSLRLKSGGNGEIIWNFSQAGEFQFACLIPGHYEAGMHGKLSVTNN